MNQLTAALKIILGDKPDGYYVAGFVFSSLAILLSLYFYSRKTRNKDSIATPRDFSFSFMIGDNIKRIGATLIVEFFLFRMFDLSDIKYMIGVGFAVAYGLDKIIQFLIDHTDIMNFLQPARKTE
jgi:hypothetical protein